MVLDKRSRKKLGDFMQKNRYITGLDGLRALAVLSVIAYHLDLPFAMGGFIGVTVFFVLSGYLITSLLLSEWEKTNTIDLKNFWFRRAKRLLPAIFLLLIVLNIIVPIFVPNATKHLHSDTIAAIFYYSNWHYIFQHLSYFETFNTPMFLTHFWSLAIEEQFYIFWAIALFWLFKIRLKKGVIASLSFIFACFSAIWMAHLYQPGTDPSRVYYGTDTRLFSLLIGASFALCFPIHHLRKLKNKFTLELFGIIGVLVILYMVCFTNEYMDFLYYGGMFLLSITTGLLVISICSPTNTLISKFFSLYPLEWIGKRSYSIYLWHYPVITFMHSKVNTAGINYWEILLELFIIFAFASLSYTFFENPIRKGKKIRLKKFALSFTLIMVMAISVSCNYSQPKPAQKSNVAHAIQKGNETKEVKAVAKTQEAKPVDETPTQTTTTTTKTPILTNATAIGDSIIIDATPVLQEGVPELSVYGKVGRQMSELKPIVQQLKKNNQLGDVVIIELGSNGAFPKEMLEEVINMIGKNRKVILINTRVPRPWCPVVNQTLEDVAKEYPNTSVIDWFSASKNHDEYFVDDGVHLTSEGADVFASLIEKKLNEINPENINKKSTNQ
jgi:peptidoglycan/LPS O-acetylase OafA/YrhL